MALKFLNTFLGIFLALGFCVLGGSRALAAGVDTAALNRTAQVQEGFLCFHSMDYGCALEVFERVRAEHRGDPLATDYVLNTRVFAALNQLDLLDTTFYATDGFLTGRHAVAADAKVSQQIEGLAEAAIDEANARLKKNGNDVDALFAKGWAEALDATYIAMAERAYGQAFRLALRARKNDAAVLAKDPNYVDAKLMVGVYDYVVGALPWEFKLLIGFVGIHGSKTEGMQLLRDDGARGVITSVEARTAIMLFLRREAKYGEAIAMAQQLSKEYPHNYLFSLEIANLEKDKGLGMTAVYAYQHTLEEARKPGYYQNAHVELAEFGLGEALKGQKHYAEAVRAYEAGADEAATSPELKQRCLLAAGETLDLAGDHGRAKQMYQEVIGVKSDTVEADKARRYMEWPYRG
ncbi:MAG: tetratricopeptide repeat protein [Acidobacteriaceae bacterium]